MADSEKEKHGYYDIPASWMGNFAKCSPDNSTKDVTVEDVNKSTTIDHLRSAFTHTLKLKEIPFDEMSEADVDVKKQGTPVSFSFTDVTDNTAAQALTGWYARINDNSKHVDELFKKLSAICPMPELSVEGVSTFLTKMKENNLEFTTENMTAILATMIDPEYCDKKIELVAVNSAEELERHEEGPECCILRKQENNDALSTFIHKIGADDCFIPPITALQTKTKQEKRMSEKAIVKFVMQEGYDDLVPTKAHESDAGYDLRSRIIGVIDPGQRLLVPTGLFLGLPSGYEGQVRSRSGMAIKAGIMVLNSPGTVDAKVA